MIGVLSSSSVLEFPGVENEGLTFINSLLSLSLDLIPVLQWGRLRCL